VGQITNSFLEAFKLIFSFDPELIEILYLSFEITIIAVLISSFIGIPLGTVLACTRFYFRKAIISIFFALMGLPPVVVGLFVYLIFSRSGTLGWMGLLYSPTVMIIAQIILITPIICCLTFQTIESVHLKYREFFQSFHIGRLKAVSAYIIDSRFELITVILAGFGRSISEVGAIIIVGGNIDHLTRVMTTAIALETSKGNLSLAMGLGIILLLVAVFVNVAMIFIKNKFLNPSNQDL